MAGAPLGGGSAQGLKPLGSVGGGLSPEELGQLQQMMMQQQLQQQQFQQQLTQLVSNIAASGGCCGGDLSFLGLGSGHGEIANGGACNSGPSSTSLLGTGLGSARLGEASSAGVTASQEAAPELPQTGESTEMAQYQQYMAALQLQQAAMVNLGVNAEGEYDHPLGPKTVDTRPKIGFRNEVVPPHDPKRRFTGSVFKWDDDAGWGFLSCLDARKVYGKDVFLHKAEIGGVADLYKQRKAVEIKNGDWVEFSVEISRGKPRARDVTKVGAPEEYGGSDPPTAGGGPPTEKGGSGSGHSSGREASHHEDSSARDRREGGGSQRARDRDRDRYRSRSRSRSRRRRS